MAKRDHIRLGRDGSALTMNNSGPPIASICQSSGTCANFLISEFEDNDYIIYVSVMLTMIEFRSENGNRPSSPSGLALPSNAWQRTVLGSHQRVAQNLRP